MSGEWKRSPRPIDFDGLTLPGVGPLAFWAYVFVAAVSFSGSRLARASLPDMPCRVAGAVKSTPGGS
ncbi:hypothetical protein AEGHOMDF_3030 [Methylobacterium soli]|nr:hypothetical protein AEGHOMDF_3030 [Methylobacterium soli]